MEHELWLTALFNDYLAGVGNGILALVGMTARNAERPWENWIVMELLVVALVMALAAAVKSSLSADKPGTLQHIFEGVYNFVKNTAEESGLHHARSYVPYFGTLFIFILLMNLIGIIPTFESPTMFPEVTAGLAVWTFLYYNFHGFREGGAGYLKHFVGPIPWLFFLMIPIEIIGHFARPLSLSMRLYGNMFGGEQVTLLFLGLTYLVVPAVFMFLHVAVSFVQAYVFTLLSTIYVSSATAHEH